MEKKVWAAPQANVEKFVANEYVAACWSVVCSVPLTGKADQWGTGAYDAVGGHHRKAFCGDPTHYQIRLDDSGVPIEMIETQTDGLGDLVCTLTLADFKTPRDIKTVTKGEMLYWTTNNYWQHSGTVTGDSNHS